MGTSSLRAGHAPVVLRVPFAASSVSVARSKLRTWMLESGIRGDVVEDARLVLSELVANSVRHAHPLPDGDILVSWKLGNQGLQISVTDGGAGTRPHKVNAPASALAGRGMAIVETLAVAWWSDKTRSRSTVHAVLAV